MNKKLLLNLVLLLMMGLVACSSSTDSKEEGKDSKGTEAVDVDGNDYLITISTNYGEMNAVLHDLTPKHKENFVKLAKEGFFNDLLFHRVKPNFMIQGGDPQSKGAPADMSLGRGSPGYEIEAEIKPELFHRKGALAAARTPNPEKRSNGSQFYIVHGDVFPREQVAYNQVALSRALGILRRDFREDPINDTLETAFRENGQAGYFNKAVELSEDISEKTGVTFVMPEKQAEVYSTIGGYPFLDGEYTVFGQVISGLDVLDKIATVQTKPDDRPVADVIMQVTVKEMSRAEIAKKYSYTDFQ